MSRAAWPADRDLAGCLQIEVRELDAGGLN
jgi:hypothetical protein